MTKPTTERANTLRDEYSDEERAFAVALHARECSDYCDLAVEDHSGWMSYARTVMQREARR